MQAFSYVLPDAGTSLSFAEAPMHFVAKEESFSVLLFVVDEAEVNP